MAFKRLEDQGVGEARDGRDIRPCDISGTLKGKSTEPSDPGTRVSSTSELLWSLGPRLRRRDGSNRYVTLLTPPRDSAIGQSTRKSPLSIVRPADITARAQETRSISTRSPPLTRREQQVAALVARGPTNRQIATELSISEHTVANHVAKLLRKLGLDSRSQITAWVIERRTPPRGTGSRACSRLAFKHGSFTRIGPKMVNSNYVFRLLAN